MKLTTLFFILVLFCTHAQGRDFHTKIDNTYESASIPNFLPFVGRALPGRCISANGANKKSASVLMVSFEEYGFDVAPFDRESGREDFFDKMGYEEILNQFPAIKKMFIEVSETAEGAVIEKEKGKDFYRGEIRESEKFMIMRVFINGQIFKFCNYIK